MRSGPSAKNITDRERPRAQQDQCSQASQVQQVRLIAWLTEMRAGSGDCLKLYRTEAVGQMHGDYRHEENDSHGYAGERYAKPGQNGRTTQQLDQDGRRGQQLGERHSQRLQDMHERFGSARQLGISVLHESEADDQPQR